MWSPPKGNFNDVIQGEALVHGADEIHNKRGSGMIILTGRPLLPGLSQCQSQECARSLWRLSAEREKSQREGQTRWRAELEKEDTHARP